MSEIRVAALKDVTPGQPYPVEVEGKPLVLVRIGDEVHALSAECSHQGGPALGGHGVGHPAGVPVARLAIRRADRAVPVPARAAARCRRTRCASTATRSWSSSGERALARGGAGLHRPRRAARAGAGLQDRDRRRRRRRAPGGLRAHGRRALGDAGDRAGQGQRGGRLPRHHARSGRALQQADALRRQRGHARRLLARVRPRRRAGRRRAIGSSAPSASAARSRPTTTTPSPTRPPATPTRSRRSATELVRALARGGAHAGRAVRRRQGARPGHPAAGHRGRDPARGLHAPGSSTSSSRASPFTPPSSVWPAIPASAVLVFGMASLLARASARGDISVVGPVFALSPIFTVLPDALLSGTLPSPLGWLGLLLAVAGTVNLSSGQAGAGANPGAAGPA